MRRVAKRLIRSLVVSLFALAAFVSHWPLAAWAVVQS